MDIDRDTDRDRDRDIDRDMDIDFRLQPIHHTSIRHADVRFLITIVQSVPANPFGPWTVRTGTEDRDGGPRSLFAVSAA